MQVLGVVKDVQTKTGKLYKDWLKYVAVLLNLHFLGSLRCTQMYTDAQMGY